MEIHQLRYFVAVAELLNFSRAAERCHVSQPSLSQQIMKLEAQLGQPLFDRESRRVALTEAGEAMLPRARQILLDLASLEQESLGQARQARAKLTVGAIPTIAPYLLPRVLGVFQKRNPGVEIAVHEAFTEQLGEMLLLDRVDVALMSTPPAGDLLDTQVLCEDPLLLCLPAGHRLAGGKPVALEKLRDEPLILLQQIHCLGRQVQAFCEHKHLLRHIACHSAQVSTVQALVKFGLGYSLLPALCAREDTDPGRIYLPPVGQRPSRSLTLVMRHGRCQPAAVTDFAAAVRLVLRGADA